ncbi:MAG: [protein-PII] uridylyltransferase [Paracoccaceae bacterium]
MAVSAPQPDLTGAPLRTEAGLAHLIKTPTEILDGADLLRAVDDAVAASADMDAARAEVIALVADAMSGGRARVNAELLAHPRAGLRIARSFAHVTDCAVTAIAHFATTHLHPQPLRTKSERLTIAAVGGYGRGEMAPFSDVDLLFLTPHRQTAWAESVVESVLYILWDLKLKVGQSTRSISECLRLAREDMTIRTALLEHRFICGDRDPIDELDQRIWNELFLKTGPDYVEAKMAERDNRHERHGGSRYLLEPNLKESKGGLRDLQTLHWISKYLYHTGTAWDLVEMGVFEREEVQRFADASKFIWAVRCHLHDLAGRAQETLTFDRQVEIAQRMGYEEGEGRLAVEHFMQTYFRHAKAVGDLTRIFSAALEAQHAKSQPTLSLLLQALSFRSNKPAGDEPFTVEAGRLSISNPDVFRDNPSDLFRLFHDAARMEAKIHPNALRAVTQSLDLVDDALRADTTANALFMDMLCNPTDAEWLLRSMNETELLGRFIPEFGRVVAMMQFNMYHHYTVDEHTIRCIGVLNQIERGEEEETLPVASEILKGGVNRKVLHTALLLHDLGKGADRDHSELGAELAVQVGPRLGLTEAETETVTWLVRHHLLMSDTAQKRDITDPRTVTDFAKFVQSPQRLRLLLVLTVCDIKGVGPGTWNNWKAQLLRNLYWDTRDVLTGGVEQSSRAHRVDAARSDLVAAIADWPESARKAEALRHYPQYWLGLDTETHKIVAELGLEIGDTQIASRFLPDETRDATKAVLFMGDHPGIFARMAGAFAIAGANVVDARSYTTNDGMATSVFWIQDRDGQAYEKSRLKRLRRTIERTLRGEVIARVEISERDRVKVRESRFDVPTRIVFDNEASDLFTVIEVNARDRLGLLHELTRTLASLNINIFAAIIATYGEHAVDVFYVKDLFGHKIRAQNKLRTIERRLTAAVESEDHAIAPLD